MPGDRNRLISGRGGVSFIRRNQGEAFAEACTTVNQRSPQTRGVNIRGGKTDDRPILNLVGGGETAPRPELARLSARMAVAHVLETVPTLLEPYDLLLDTVQVNRNTRGAYFIELFAGEDARPTEERGQILDALSALVPESPIRWSDRVPGVTLISADADMPSEVIDFHLEVVEGILPVRTQFAMVHTSPRS